MARSAGRPSGDKDGDVERQTEFKRAARLTVGSIIARSAASRLARRIWLAGFLAGWEEGRSCAIGWTILERLGLTKRVSSKKERQSVELGCGGFFGVAMCGGLVAR